MQLDPFGMPVFRPPTYQTLPVVRPQTQRALQPFMDAAVQTLPFEVPPVPPEVGPIPAGSFAAPASEPEPTAPPAPAPAPQQSPLATAATAAQAQAQTPTVRNRTVPPDIYAIAQREAARTGLPVGYLLSIMSRESGFRPDARNPESSAGGVAQLLLSTATNPGYGVNPISDEDRFNPERAIPFMADYLVGRGRSLTGGTFDPKNPQHLALAARAYGPGTEDYVKGVMDDAGLDWSPGDAPAGQQQGPDRTRGWEKQDPINDLIMQAVLGNPGQRAGEEFDKVPEAMSTRNVMLGLASGLLQGPTLGTGLGKGIENVLGLTGREEKNAIARAQAIARVGERMPERLLAAGNLLERQENTRLRAATVAQQDQRIEQARQSYMLQQERLGFSREEAQRRWDMFRITNDPAAILSREGARTSGQGDAKAAGDAWTGLMNSSEADYGALADINSALDQIKTNPGYFGSDPASRITRFLAQMGISGDPNDISAIQKMTAQARNEYLQNLTGGHVGGIRSNSELQNLSAAMADITTNPKAAEWIMQLRKNTAERNIAWRKRVVELQAQDPMALRGRDYFLERDKFEQQWHQTNPLPQYRPSTPGTRDGGSTQSTSPTSGRTRSGVTWSLE